MHINTNCMYFSVFIQPASTLFLIFSPFKMGILIRIYRVIGITWEIWIAKTMVLNSSAVGFQCWPREIKTMILIIQIFRQMCVRVFHLVLFSEVVHCDLFRTVHLENLVRSIFFYSFIHSFKCCMRIFSLRDIEFFFYWPTTVCFYSVRTAHAVYEKYISHVKR